MAALFHFSEPEVTQFFQQGKTLHRSHLCVCLVLPKAFPYARLLVVTPRAIGSAPARNTIRRRLKSAFYKMNLSDKELFDYALIMRKGGLYLSFNDAQALLNHLVMLAHSENK